MTIWFVPILVGGTFAMVVAATIANLAFDALARNRRKG